VCSNFLPLDVALCTGREPGDASNVRVEGYARTVGQSIVDISDKTRV